MNKLIIISAVCVSALFSACSSDDYAADNAEAKNLQLATAVEAQESRAGTSIQSTQFVSGQKVGVWTFTGTGTSAEFKYKNTPMTTDGKGGLSSASGIYYDPAKTVNVWAIHPYDETWTTKWNTSTAQKLIFTMPTDQSTQANYANADLCVGHLAGIKADGTKHIIPMKHLMSKITLKIVDGDANDGFTVNNDHIDNAAIWTKYKVQITTRNTFAADADPIASVAPYEGIGQIKCAGSASTSKLNSSAIVPSGQTYAAGDKLIFIMLNPFRSPIEYKLPSALTLQPGTEYIFTVRISLRKVEVTMDLADWNIVRTSGVLQY